jgi:hypothetical protein
VRRTFLLWIPECIQNDVYHLAYTVSTLQLVVLVGYESEIQEV